MCIIKKSSYIFNWRNILKRADTKVHNKSYCITSSEYQVCTDLKSQILYNIVNTRIRKADEAIPVVSKTKMIHNSVRTRDSPSLSLTPYPLPSPFLTFPSAPTLSFSRGRLVARALRTRNRATCPHCRVRSRTHRAPKVLVSPVGLH